MKLIDLFESSYGIFSEIDSINSALETPLFPWLTNALATELDNLYYLSHSGDKCISKYYKRLIEREEKGIIASSLTALANSIMMKFGDKWNRLYEVFITEHYNPLENYNMEQKETPNVTRTKNVKSDVTVKNDVYGFNSTAKVPQSESNTSGEKLNNEETETETGTRDLERSGNIGVTTSQQMLQSEIDLRNGYNFYDGIMSDLDSIICLLVY